MSRSCETNNNKQRSEMRIRKMMAIAAMSVLVGCGYNESTPEGFYMSCVDAWAHSDFDKVLSMHYVTDRKPKHGSDPDFSRRHIEQEIRSWANEEGEKTPMAVCRRALKKITRFGYHQDDDDIKVLWGESSGYEHVGPLLHIEKVDGEWKVTTATDSETSRQDWVRLWL